MKKSMLGIFLFLLWLSPIANGQSTAFTYQGKLTDSGNLANGQYDLQFKLFDTQAIGTGTQQGITVTVANVTVTNGSFTVSLDFAICASCFNGSARFLEIAVKPTSGSTFTTLSPRQPITATPYALKSQNATTADGLSIACVNCITSSQIQSVQGSQVTGNITGSQINGTIPVASVPAGSANYIQNSSSQQASSNFNISGTGTANILNAATQYNLNGLRAFTVNGAFNNGSFIFTASNTFAGDGAGVNTTPDPSLTGLNGKFNSFFGAGAGQANTNGQSNSFFGSQAGSTNTSGINNAFFGSGTGKANTTGFQNSFFGIRAGVFNTTGFNNTFIGFQANFNTSNPTVGNNTVHSADANVNSGVSNGTAIGAKASVTQSDSLILSSINGVNSATADTQVGIGTTAPNKHLHILGSGDQEIAIESSDASGRQWTLQSSDGASNGRFEIIDLTANVSRITILSTGLIGIGTTVPADRLDVAGDIRVGTSGTNGCLKNNNGGTIVGTCSSDARFKRDITPFANLLSKIVQLRPVHFYWRAGDYPERHFGQGQEAGLIAQEVEKVLPELVTEDAQGFKAVNYSKLPLMSVQAIKELKTENNLLKQKISEQQVQLTAQQI